MSIEGSFSLRSDRKETIICWSCGGKTVAGVCEVCGGREEVVYNEPRVYLGFCGREKKDLYQGVGEEREMRSCCVCHREWLCTIDEWINGRCPHCGTSGSGMRTIDILTEIKTTPIEKFNAEAFKKIRPIQAEKYLREIENFILPSYKKKTIGDLK